MNFSQYDTHSQWIITIPVAFFCPSPSVTLLSRNSIPLLCTFISSNFFFCCCTRKKERTTETINNRIRIHIVTNYLRSVPILAAGERMNERMKQKKIDWCERMDGNEKSTKSILKFYRELMAHSSYIVRIDGSKQKTLLTVRETALKPQFNEDSIFQQVFKDRISFFLCCCCSERMR